jgi:hypothetical protein
MSSQRRSGSSCNATSPIDHIAGKKYLLRFQNYVPHLSHPASSKGRIAIVMNAGRDAVDATVSCAHEVAGRRKS